jgi:hypothetical protein
MWTQAALVTSRPALPPASTWNFLFACWTCIWLPISVLAIVSCTSLTLGAYSVGSMWRLDNTMNVKVLGDN